MLCIVIKGPSLEEAYQQLVKAKSLADIVELRLDLFSSLDLETLKECRSSVALPMIFTLRSREQGGGYAGSEKERLADLFRLSELHPEYLDIEASVPPSEVQKIAQHSPNTKIILSYHDFEGLPSNLEELYQSMARTPARWYKIAVTASSAVDAMRFLCWANQCGHHPIAMVMGPHGNVSRILGPVIGSPLTYASLESHLQTAPGQLSAETLVKQYRFRSLHPGSSIYGLIGDPVDKSLSRVTHNALCTAMGLDAVYVQIQVKPDEVPSLLALAKQLPFRGLSVTMPLKEVIVPYVDVLDEHARAIRAVNTLLFDGGTITGANTDGQGALDAIERHVAVEGKRMVIIGAGGAAKAIAYEARRRGVSVTLVGRNADKTKESARLLHVCAKRLDQMGECVKEGYDILVNATPSEQPIAQRDMLPGTCVMDICSVPMMTPFLRSAVQKGCHPVYGYEMFVEQAVGQWVMWFPHLSPSECRAILEKKAQEELSNPRV